MDKIVKYNYAYGGMEDLRKGIFENMHVSSSLHRLKIDSGNRGVVIPNFVGVYQEADAIPEHPDEKMYGEFIKKEFKRLDFLINRVAKEILERRGREERFNANLIHIGYDPDLYDEKLVRELFINPSPRIVISSYRELPYFGRKDTSGIEMVGEKLRELFETVEEREEGVPILRTISEEACSIFNREGKKYGLTRQEYAFLQILDRWKRTCGEGPKISLRGKDILYDVLDLEKDSDFPYEDLI